MSRTVGCLVTYARGGLYGMYDMSSACCLIKYFSGATFSWWYAQRWVCPSCGNRHSWNAVHDRFSSTSSRANSNDDCLIYRSALVVLPSYPGNKLQIRSLRSLLTLRWAVHIRTMLYRPNTNSSCSSFFSLNSLSRCVDGGAKYWTRAGIWNRD